MRRGVRIGSVATVVALLTACAGGYSSQDMLQRRVDRFNNDVRWGRFYSAAEYFQDASDRREWLSSRREWGEELRIADYEVVDSTMEEDGETAVVRVVFSWYRMSVSEVQTTMLAQRWRREGRQWNLISEEVEEGAPL